MGSTHSNDYAGHICDNVWEFETLPRVLSGTSFKCWSFEATLIIFYLKFDYYVKVRKEVISTIRGILLKVLTLENVGLFCVVNVVSDVTGSATSGHIMIPMSEFYWSGTPWTQAQTGHWPLIGREWSHDLDIGLWLVEAEHRPDKEAFTVPGSISSVSIVMIIIYVINLIPAPGA